MADLAMVGNMSANILTHRRNILHCLYTSFSTYCVVFRFYYPFKYFSCFFAFSYSWCNLIQLRMLKIAAIVIPTNLMVIAV